MKRLKVCFTKYFQATPFKQTQKCYPLRKIFISMYLQKLYLMFAIFFTPLMLHAEKITPNILPQTLEKPIHRTAYMALSSGILIGGTVAGAGILYLLPESVTNWDKNEIVNLGSNWKRKVSQGPIVDSDDFFLNWITHPYWGAVYYMQPRIAGFSWAESALYSIIFSTFFWEYGIESFAEIPSWQDIIITPAIGSILGELFYRATIHIHKKQDTLLGSRFLGKSALLLMDPIGFILQNTKLTQSKYYDIQGSILPINDKMGIGLSLKIIMRFG